MGRKKKEKNAPLPPPGMPLPPMPPMPNMGAMPPPPEPTLPPAPLPPMPNMDAQPSPVEEPAPIPTHELPPQPTMNQELPPPAPLDQLPPPPSPIEVSDSTGENSSSEYQNLWAKRSEKPLQQIYGHIDRISNEDAGSLLDRYADRFGHSLDREIIVLRKNEHQQKVAEIREAPTVTLLDDEIEETPSETFTSIEEIENEIRRLKPLYQRAKESGQSEEIDRLKQSLQDLLAQRKSLLEPTVADVSNNQDDALFIQFFSIVDALLESSLPGDITQEFINGPDFSLYMEVGQNPAGSTDYQRSEFVAMIDKLLEDIDENSQQEFTQSADFDIYKDIVIKYSG